MNSNYLKIVFNFYAGFPGRRKTGCTRRGGPTPPGESSSHASHRDVQLKNKNIDLNQIPLSHDLFSGWFTKYSFIGR